MTDLRLPSLTDACCGQGDTTVTHLNLSFNQITDVGVQILVTAIATGAGKGLKEINIANNQFGDMGARMLSGVGMMRKGLKVVYESAIGNIRNIGN